MNGSARPTYFVAANVKNTKKTYSNRFATCAYRHSVCLLMPIELVSPIVRPSVTEHVVWSIDIIPAPCANKTYKLNNAADLYHTIYMVSPF